MNRFWAGRRKKFYFILFLLLAHFSYFSFSVCHSLLKLWVWLSWLTSERRFKHHGTRLINHWNQKQDMDTIHIPADRMRGEKYSLSIQSGETTMSSTGPAVLPYSQSKWEEQKQHTQKTHQRDEYRWENEEGSSGREEKKNYKSRKNWMINDCSRAIFSGFFFCVLYMCVQKASCSTLRFDSIRYESGGLERCCHKNLVIIFTAGMSSSVVWGLEKYVVLRSFTLKIMCPPGSGWGRKYNLKKKSASSISWRKVGFFDVFSMA